MFSSKIIFLINSLDGGGAEKLNIEYSRQMNGSELYTLESSTQYSVESDIIKSLSISLEGRVMNYISLPYKAYKLIREIESDSIIIASLFRSWLVAIFAKIFQPKLKIIIWVHDDPKRGTYKYNSIKRLFDIIIYYLSNKVVFNSKGARKESIKRKDTRIEKTKVIYNGFNFNGILKKGDKDLNQTEKSYFKNKNIIYVGRLSEKKNLFFLLDVFNQVSKNNDSISLILIGDGSQRKELKEYSIKLGVEDKIKFLGFKNNPYKYIKSSDIFLFPTYYEGFGNVIVESLSLKTKVISSDIDFGPREIMAPNSPYLMRTTETEIIDGIGCLLPIRNKEKIKLIIIWSEAIQSVIDMEFNSSCSRNLLDRYSLDKVLIEWNDLFDEM